MTTRKRTLWSLSLLAGLTNVDAFGLPFSPDLHLHLQSLAQTSNAFFSAPAQHLDTPGFLAASTETNPNVFEIVSTIYREELRNDPLKTKVLTGIFLAVVGDALAQARDRADYNVKRAASFAAFDGCYRAVQQVTYPPMMQLCSGKFLAGVLATLGVAATSPDQVHLMASIEQTLVSQLVIIPTLYYPVFYAVTGAVQGLTIDETMTRAKETFIPLMKRNLLFWIPVQFIAFNFVEENLQIPILIVCGLVWTIILSVAAGAAKAAPSVAETEVLGMENVVLQEDGAYYKVAADESLFSDSETKMRNVDITERIGRSRRANDYIDADRVGILSQAELNKGKR